MLKIKNISKQYKTGELVQKALDDVSLELRDSEFVAVLGPSGSGKTTLLNIIGGLDRYDSGDLIINGVSTKKYKHRDWDSYRNHTIGFVFQSYNLIAHQTVLANVELALTIAGISRSERKKRAVKALEDVGLGDQLHKKPNQLSGGQMQRVAIARALVNDPDILLADEPTGALDSQTSIQVMELLKKVAKDRLVVMVTHNPELAQQYATRIIKLKDGRVTDDSDPFEAVQEEKESKSGRAKMGFATSLSLSLNNLLTKKGRTILTSFAGSIGIIGIALILALSTGVNTFIYEKQKETMLSYPISITSRAVDMNAVMNRRNDKDGSQEKERSGGVYVSYSRLQRRQTRRSSIMDNDLTSFKKYLDDPDSEIRKYLGENGVVYTYDLSFEVFSRDSSGRLVNSGADPDDIDRKKTASNRSENNPTSVLTSLNGATGSGADNFTEIMKGSGDNAVSDAIKSNYDLEYGDWCSSYDEVVLVLDEDSTVSAESLYQLGIITKEEYSKAAEEIKSGRETAEKMFSYEEVCGRKFYLVAACDRYVSNGNGTFSAVSELDEEKLLKNAVELKISGIVKAKEDIKVGIDSAVGYTCGLTKYVIDHTDNSEVVKAQEAAKDVNVLTGMRFDAPGNDAKLADARKYISSLGVGDKASLYTMAVYMGAAADEAGENADENTRAKLLDKWAESKESSAFLITIYDNYVAGANYNDNMERFGKVSLDAPSAINIYCDSFEDKDRINECIEKYNDSVDSEKKITYTDYVALITESITSIVNSITYVLIAFVAVSLVVSSIMIGIITHISVLERTKEIGILRALGASKRNISQVFNAETFIIGLLAGTLGVVISEILIVPINAVIARVIEDAQVTARLPIVYSLLLIGISMAMTMIGGFIPAKRAAKKDPVIALRTE